MLTLNRTFISDAKTKTKEEFLEIYKHPFIVQHESQSLSKTQPQIVFATITAKSLESLIKQHTQAQNAGKLIKSVYPIVKSNRNPFASKIIIGRTSTQDIVIEDPSISKFHAYFEVKEDGCFTICDRGSTNGTSLNSIPLIASSPKEIKDTDIISFSNASFTFHTPESAYNIFKTAIE